MPVTVDGVPILSAALKRQKYALAVDSFNTDTVRHHSLQCHDDIHNGQTELNAKRSTES